MTEDRPDPRPARRDLYVFWGGFILIVALYIGMLVPRTYYQVYVDDPSWYYVSAKSLAEGKGYRYISHPDNPPASEYPIGYPLLMAPVIAASGNDMDGIYNVRVQNAVFCALWVIITFLYLSRRIPPLYAAFSALIIGAYPYVVIWSSFIASEWSFCVLFFLMLPMIEHLKRIESPARAHALALLIGVIMAYMVLQRSIAVTIGAGVGIYFLVHRRWTWLAAFLVGGALVAVPWLQWSITHKGEAASRYTQQFLQEVSLTTPLNNLKLILVSTVPQIFFPSFETNIAHRLGGPWIAGVLGTLLVGLWLIGYVRRIRDRELDAWVVTPYMALVIVWPWDPWRFMIPLLPLFFWQGYVGATIVGDWLQRTGRTALYERGRKLAVPLLALSFLSAFPVDVMWIRLLQKYHHHGGPEAAKTWQNNELAHAWVRDNTPPDAIIITPHSQGLYLFTKRQAATYYSVEMIEKTVATARRMNRPAYIYCFERRSAAQAYLNSTLR